MRNKRNDEEVRVIEDSITEIHNKDGIPYDEIAVIIFNKKYHKQISGWRNKNYNLEWYLDKIEGIPFCDMYSTEGPRYGDDGGVSLISLRSVLGLDFRAAIVCGLLPLGEYDKTKKPDWDNLRDSEEEFIEALENTKNNIRFLYVACTRAREILHIILPESGKSSVFIKMLEDANKE